MESEGVWQEKKNEWLLSLLAKISVKKKKKVFLMLCFYFSKGKLILSVKAQGKR